MSEEAWQDDSASRKESVLPKAFDRALARLIGASEMDASLISVLVSAVTSLASGAALLFSARAGRLGLAGHLMGIAYVACLVAIFLQRSILALHYGMHRPPGGHKRAFRMFAHWVLSPLIGIPIGCYRLHHVLMHHKEDNTKGKDLSSTEAYQRDSFLQFLIYWLRFALLGPIELPLYGMWKGHTSASVESACGIAFHFALVAFFSSIDPVATAYIFTVPLVLVSFLLMAGNWTQHAFVDPDEPRNVYRSSFTLANHSENQHTFNDGYHTVHHLCPGLHWTQLPAEFRSRLSDHAKNDALVFSGCSIGDVALFVFSGRLHKLAEKYVDIGNRGRSREDIIALLQHRLRPVRHCV